jgi:flagellar motor switch/type III secretory pathway protein FliN
MPFGSKPQSFPWRLLDRVTKTDLAFLREARRYASSVIPTRRLAEALEEQLRARIEVRVRRIDRLSSPGGFDDAIAVALSPSGSSRGDARILVEAERPLALAVVAHALSARPRLGPGPASFGQTPLGPASLGQASFEQASFGLTPLGQAPLGQSPPGQASLGPTLTGAFAAVIASAVRRSRPSEPGQRVAPGAAADLEADLLRLYGSALALSLTVLIADDAFAARIVVAGDPMRAAFADAGEDWTRQDLARLGGTPLSLPLVAVAFRSMTAEMAAIRRGDVIVPEGWPLTKTQGEGWRGRLWLAAPGENTGLRAEVGDDERLMLAGESDPLCGTEAEMDNLDESTLVTSLGDVPVVVRVEVGEATMSAREWASVGRGDVIALGRRVGERVLIRIGGVPVARGELVDIEGEVGVRITGRIRADGDAP